MKHLRSLGMITLPDMMTHLADIRFLASSRNRIGPGKASIFSAAEKKLRDGGKVYPKSNREGSIPVRMRRFMAREAT